MDPDVPDLEELYDPDVLARIEAHGPTGGVGGGHLDPGGGAGGDLAGDPGDGSGSADEGDLDDAVDLDWDEDWDEWVRRALSAPDAGADTGVATAEDGSDGVVAHTLPRYPRTRRFGISAAMLAGAMFGVAEVFEGERPKDHIVQYVPSPDDTGQPVTFLMVPGDPRASRLIIRPWLRRKH
jgi:hypothetical protein